MSEDEIFVFVVCSVLTAAFWLRWYRYCQALTWLRAGRGPRLVVIAVPAVCGVVLWLVLRNLAADEVRDAPQYLAFYLVLGAAWIGFGVRLMGLLGLSVRNDALERRNAAAAWAAAGALLGLTLCYAGANIGNGPGWWVVVYSAGLSTGSLLVLWLILDCLTHAAETETVSAGLGASRGIGPRSRRR